jgi:hypothetical protein
MLRQHNTGMIAPSPSGESPRWGVHAPDYTLPRWGVHAPYSNGLVRPARPKGAPKGRTLLGALGGAGGQLPAPCAHAGIYIHTHIVIDIHIHTHTHRYTHTYTHTYMHTHIVMIAK